MSDNKTYENQSNTIDTAIKEEPTAPLRLKHILWMLLLIVVCNLFFFPVNKIIVSHKVDSNGDSYSYDSLVQKMNTANPRVVLLGNSMVGNGINVEYFNDLTKTPTYILYLGGSESAWWYLAFKNIICKSKIQIPTVAFFFRDNELTDPTYRVTGAFKPRIDMLCDSNEEVLDHLAYFNNLTNFDFMLSSNWPLYQKKDSVKSKIDIFIKEKTAKYFFNRSGKDIDDAIKTVFADTNMNKELFTKYQFKIDQNASSEFDFKKNLNTSFLPQIISLAKRNNIKLLFVRVKKRRDLIPYSQPTELLNYMSALSEYLEKQNITFIDFTNDRRIAEKDYTDGDHLDNRNSPMTFTKLLADTLPQFYSKVY